MRYKISLMFILLMLAPSLSSMLQVITLPTKNLISTSATPFSFFLSLLSFQLLALLWVSLQGMALKNQPWSRYLSSLPLTDAQKLISTLLVLFVSDFILWIPLIVAAGEIAGESNGFSNILLIAGKSILQIMLVLFLQIAWKERSLRFLRLVVIGDIVLLAPSAISGVALLFILNLFMLFVESRISKTKHLSEYRTPNESFSIKNNNLSFLTIQVKNLCVDNLSQVVIPLSTLAAVLSVVLCWSRYNINDPNLKFILSIVMLINALILSNLFARLDTQRKQISLYLASLPLTKWGIFRGDALLVGVMLFVLNVTLLAIVRFSFGGSSLFMLMSASLFLVLTYWPQIYFKRYGLFVSAGIMPFFIAINYFMGL